GAAGAGLRPRHRALQRRPPQYRRLPGRHRPRPPPAGGFGPERACREAGAARQACSSWAGPRRRTRSWRPPGPGSASPTGIDAGRAHSSQPPEPPQGRSVDALRSRMLSLMTTSASDPFESLLSRRARIGWGGAVATPRPSMSALYEFGGAYPDPASFPYDGMVE